MTQEIEKHTREQVGTSQPQTKPNKDRNEHNQNCKNVNIDPSPLSAGRQTERVAPIVELAAFWEKKKNSH